MQAPMLRRTGYRLEESVVEDLARQQWRGYPFRLENFPAGRQIAQASLEFQARAAMEIVRWLQRRGATYDSNSWKMRQALFLLFKHKLPLPEGDILTIVEWSTHVRNAYWRGMPQIIKLVSEHLKGADLSPQMRGRLEALVRVLQAEPMSVEVRRQVMRLNELMGKREIGLPLEQGDVWADAALEEIRALNSDEQSAWAELLLQCLRVTGSAPSKKWMKDAEGLLARIGEQKFCSTVMHWFELADKPRPTDGHREVGEIPLAANADLLKGLAWICSRFDEPEVARALSLLALSAYRRLKGQGPRAAKIGNACFWALGSMPSPEGLAQLSILKAKIKGTSPQKAIAAAIDLAAQRTGKTIEEVEELGVPTYGLDANGSRTYGFGEAITRIQIVGSAVEQVWERNGERIAAAPKKVREERAAELHQIQHTVKDAHRMLLAQRDRIDGLYLSPRKWPLKAWRARYLDHPVVGAVARRLIWKFSKGDRAESGIWHAGRIVGRDGKPLDWLEDSTVVELWHPISVSTEVVLAWREWLTAHEVQQPFKQAHREIYPLTDAERATNTYSNRYAAHILRQHQFNALCAARGWKNALRLMVDNELPPAIRQLPHWGLRAEFWIEGIGDIHDTNDTGTYLFITTDQVRFYRSDALQTRAHARGGGYYAPRWNNRGSADPLSLDQIPELVFSEIMRDADLFVGVASIGNDPNWLDQGAGARYRDYWHGYSFGELTESAKTRKQVLEGLLPGLKISCRCALTDKFLVVRGDIRTYKIHLGSSNILMEPNDQYLCIVPSRGKPEAGKERLFLPFEGDHTLAVILSKAMMLAEDRKITDETILRQIAKSQ